MKPYSAFRLLGLLAAASTTAPLCAQDSSFVQVEPVSSSSTKFHASSILATPSYLYVTSFKPLGMFIFERATLKQIKYVPLTFHAINMDINPAANELYMTAVERSTVIVLDIKSLNNIHRKRSIKLPADTSPSHVVFDAKSHSLYVADGRNPLLYSIKLSSNDAIKSHKLAAPAQELLLEPKTNRLFAGFSVNRTSPTGRIDVLDTRTMTPTRTLRFQGHSIKGMALDSATDTLFVLSRWGAFLTSIKLSEKTIATGKLFYKAMPGDGESLKYGQGLLFDATHNRLCVQSHGMNADWTSFVSPTTLEIQSRVMVRGGVMALGHSSTQSGTSLYVPQSEGPTWLVLKPQ